MAENIYTFTLHRTSYYSTRSWGFLTSSSLAITILHMCELHVSAREPFVRYRFSRIFILAVAVLFSARFQCSNRATKINLRLSYVFYINCLRRRGHTLIIVVIFVLCILVLWWYHCWWSLSCLTTWSTHVGISSLNNNSWFPNHFYYYSLWLLYYYPFFYFLRYVVFYHYLISFFQLPSFGNRLSRVWLRETSPAFGELNR